MSKRFTLFAFLFMLPMVAMAQTPLYIITGSGSAFTAAKNGATVGIANRTISYVIDDIRKDANGADCEIQFGDGETELDLNTASVTFSTFASQKWGKVVILGKIVSSITAYTENTITIDEEMSLESKVSIKRANGANIGPYNLIQNKGTGTLTISGGTISGYQYAVLNSGTGTIAISGGTISGTSTLPVVRNTSTGTITISGGTILGSVSNGAGTIDISGGTISGNYTAVSNTSTGTITIRGGTISGTTTVRNTNTGTITISGGTISGTSYVVTNTSETGSGTIAIKGGTISGTDSSAVYNDFWGNTFISGGSITSGVAEKDGGTIQLAYADGRLEITGGTITNTAENGNAVYSARSFPVNLGRNPDIIGNINLGSSTGRINIITSGSDAFNPSGEKLYTIAYSSYSVGKIAVTNGKNFRANFEVANGYTLVEKDNDLVTALPGFEFEYDESKATYVITRTESVEGMSIQNAIDAIRTIKNGNDCSIQFGDGTKELKTVGDYADFTGNWGNITLLGKISSTTGGTTVNIGDNIKLESKADIRNTYGIGIRNNGTGILTISNGTLSSVRNASTGTVNINGGVITGGTNVVQNNKGTLNINSGVITGNDYVVYNTEDGTLNINGGMVKAVSGRTIRNVSGVFTIKGGMISATGDHEAIQNNSGKIVILGTANITSESSSNGTVYLQNNGASTAVRLEITGGTITNAVGGNAIYNQSPGSILLGGSPNINGKIWRSAAAGGLSVDNTFAPGEKNYFLDFASYTVNNTAVTNGAEFSENFALANSTYGVSVTGPDLIIMPSTTYNSITVTSGANGTAEANLVSAKNGTQITLAATPDAGYRLKEWVVTAGGIIVPNTNPATFMMPNKAVAVNAVFELIPTYTVTFNSNGGSDVGVQTIPYGNLLTKPADPTKEGFSFLGWFSELLNRLWDFAIDLVKSDITLNAEWSEISSGSELPSSSSSDETQSSSSSDDGTSSSSSSSSSDDGMSSSSSSSSEGTPSSSSSSSSNGTQNSSSSETEISSSSNNDGTSSSSSSSSDGASPVIISRIASGQTTIQATSNAILLENLPSNAKVQIYDLRGKLIYSQFSILNSQFIPIQTKGLYFIKINGAVSRVVVR